MYITRGVHTYHSFHSMAQIRLITGLGLKLGS